MFWKTTKFMRLGSSLKQTDLSKQLNISNNTLAHFESQYSAVTLEVACLIARAYGFDLIFINKRNKKNYIFKDVQRMNYNSSIRSKKVTITSYFLALKYWIVPRFLGTGSEVQLIDNEPFFLEICLQVYL